MVVINQINNFKIGNSIFLGTIEQLNYIALVTPGIASPNKALVVDGNRDITNINSLSANILIANNLQVTTLTASNISGTLTTSAQPNITSVGTLTSLTVNGTTTLTGTTNTFGTCNFGDNVNLPGITNVTGTLQINGNSVTASASEINSVSGITPGVAAANRFMLLDSNKTISGVTNIIASKLQPNTLLIGGIAISATTWLTSGIISNSLATTCTISPSSGTIASAVFTSFQQNTLNGTSATIVTNSASVYIHGSPLAGTNMTITNAYALWINTGKILFADTIPSTSTSTGTLVVNGGVGIGGSLYAAAINAPTASFNALTLAGTAITATAAQLNSIGIIPPIINTTTVTCTTLNATSAFINNLTLNGTLLTVTAAQLNSIFTNLTVSGTVTCTTLNATNASINNLTLNGTLLTVTAAQLNSIFTNLNVTGTVSALTGSFTNLTLNGTPITASASQINGLGGITAGTLSANKFVLVDSSKNINEFRVDGQLYVGDLIGTNGMIKFNNISNRIYLHTGKNTIGSTVDFCITNIDQDINSSIQKIIFKADGTVGVGTSTPSRQLEINSTTGSCLQLTYNDVVSSSLTMNVNGDLSITTGRSVCIGSTVSSNLPLEVGKYTYTLLSSYGWLRSNGSIGSSLLSLATDFSIRADGRIICKTEINVTSDRRVKSHITDLSPQFCKNFITNTTPVSFRFTHGNENKTHYGYIAQDIIKAGYEQLVGVIYDDTLEKTVDDDGFISPAGQQLILCYDEIIPILAKNISMLYEQLEEQKKIIQDLLKSR